MCTKVTEELSKQERIELATVAMATGVVKVNLSDDVPSVRSKLDLADPDCYATWRLLNVGNTVTSIFLD